MGVALDARADDGGSISIGLADAPAVGDDPRSRFYVVDVVEPAARVERRVRVGNETSVGRTIDVYVSDAAVEDGAFRLVDGAADLTAWSSERTTLEIPAGETATADVSFDVPDDATDGERYGVIWAEPHGADDSGVVNRVGVRVYLLVDAEGRSRTELVVDTMRPRRDDKGQAEVVVAMSNTGARATDVHGVISLDGGAHTGTIDNVVTLAPGETRQATMTIEGAVAEGPWDAELALDVNGIERRATATIEFPTGAGETGEQIAASMVHASRAPPPVLVALAGALVAVVLVAVARLRVRRRGVAGVS